MKANKYPKRCPTSLSTSRYVKLTTKSPYICPRIMKMQETDLPKCWQGCRLAVILTHCWWECKMVQSHWTRVWRLRILNKHLPDDPATPVPTIYPRESKVYIRTKTCRLMFAAALIGMAKTWQHRKYPSTLQQVSRYPNCCVIHTVEYSSVIKWNKLPMKVVMEIHLQIPMLSDRRRCKGVRTYCTIPST